MHPHFAFDDSKLDWDISPTPSSLGSDFDSPILDTLPFLATHSPVIRLFDLPPSPASWLSAIFHPRNANALPRPHAFWALRDSHSPHRGSVWAVFASHDDASLALSVLAAMRIAAAPALPTDLAHLRPLHLKHPVRPKHPHSPRPLSPFTPPPPYAPSPPRPEFRLGDWICAWPSCAAHNFGRNTACIGCGLPRAPHPPPPTPPAHAARFPSPRFPTPAPTASAPPSPAPPPAPGAPLLTPSGRAFAVGGRVRDLSADARAPCVLFWPDNEPLPEAGQIRPAALVGMPQPPILNTGNRGPIEHQPGDWVCRKCSYLNWRRRKVCQTCYPYAQGNGDSISQSVQEGRIALLTSVLARTQPPAPAAPAAAPGFPRPRASPPPRRATPIYQTPAPPAPRRAALLQDGAPSPASSASGEPDGEERARAPALQHRPPPPPRFAGSIWRLDGEEARRLSALRLGDAGATRGAPPPPF